jgi:phosphoenolpyruvate-protein phosphotransferase (PTS system enzyme I)
MSLTDKTAGKPPLKFRGISINQGRVAAPLCLFSVSRQRSVPEYTIDSALPADHENLRYARARQECTEELDRIAKEVEKSMGSVEAEIFITQKHIMNDPKIVDAINGLLLSTRKNAEWALAKVFGSFEEKFAALDNEYLRERTSDINEVRRRLMGCLTDIQSGFVCEGQSHCSRGARKIIIAEELTSTMIVNMKMESVLGFVTEHGGITSHAAILARALGIPAITGVEGIMAHVHCGDTVLINGDTGEVYLHPDAAILASLIQPVPDVEHHAEIAVTPLGMEVMANASTIEDVRQAFVYGADGIGLFRTEILFVGAERLLSEEEQFAHYAKIGALMGAKPITFRMLDIGGDKPLPFLRLKKEANPFLGWRGARFLLGNPDIFRNQIHALGRLSLNRKINILFPMVIDSVQMQLLIDRSREILAGIEHDSANIKFGAMFEVPSAFIQARQIMKIIDFSSIGSNDLIQYLFAIDRDNEMVSQDYNPEHPALWTFLLELSRTAQELHKPLSICGEMAAREGTPTKLLNAGISSLSVAPRLIPRVRAEMIGYSLSKR